MRLFIVHAPEDGWFVEGFLLEALRLSDGEVLVSSKLEAGAVVVKEIARGALSPVTVAVVSPAFLASPWAQFASDLATHQSVEAADDGRATLVPAILADCQLPLLSRFRVPLDFRNQDREHWEAEADRLRNKLAAPAPVVASVLCPYQGIRSFTTEDAARFHGRDEEVTDLLGRLRDGQRELYVIAPSGSGKSSLVAAGLVPSLRHSPDLAGGSFLVRQMRPGSDPTGALADVLAVMATKHCDAVVQWLGDAVDRLLANHPGHDRLLIVVDQLEELFTTAESHARAAFLIALRALRNDARVALVLTLRADFYAQLMESALWADLGERLSRLDVSPLRGHKLRMAIEAPARGLGVYFEPVLVERLLHDVAHEPGALPLLQDTLLVLWHRRTHGLLRLAEYDAMSVGMQTGLAVTVARRANGALNDLSPGRREIARRVLLRLVQFGDGTATTRRQQPRAALATAGDAPEDIDAVIHHLADRRLVTTSGGDDMSPWARVDLAHEVLLSAWPALGEWIRTRKEDEQRRRVLEAKAAEWVKSGRGQSRLLDADELREVRSWLSDEKVRDLGVNEEIQNLLARSEAALTAQVAEAKGRRHRWRRWVTVAIVVLTSAVVVASTLAVKVRRQLARSYVSQGQALLMSGHPAQAAPYLLAAREAGAEDVSLRTLFRWAAQGLPLLRFVHHGPVVAVAWAPRGGAVTDVATASEDHTARVWDAFTGKAVTPPLAHQGGVWAVAWSPRNALLATASEDHTARVWDVATGRAVMPPLVHQAEVWAVAWSPDGQRIATASEDHTARVWDVGSGQAVTPPLVHQGGVWAVAWSPDGQRVVTASQDQTARIWDAVTGRPVTPPLAHQDAVVAVAWSPDGRQVVTGSWDHTARVWDAVSGQAVTPPLMHQDAVVAVAWSPIPTGDDRLAWSLVPTGDDKINDLLVQQGDRARTRVATASDDHTARVWDVVTGQPVTPPLVHREVVRAVAWSPNGQRVATASDDQTARVWDAASGQPVTPPLAHQDAVVAVAWSPNGQFVATASHDHTSRLWNAASGQAVLPSLPHQNGGRPVRVKRDPNLQYLIAPAAWEWPVDGWQVMVPPSAHQGGVWAVAWSPDGKRVATASQDQTARIWDAVTGRPLAFTRPLAHQDAVVAVAWSPDRKRVATASHDHTARVWDPGSGQPVTPPLAHQDAVVAVAWSPDGQRVATASDDHTARVWDAVSGQEVTPPLVHQGRVWAATWSPDGKQVATASDDHTARIWDVSTGRLVTPPLVHYRVVRAVAWSPDGKRVATASDDWTARVWDAGTGQPLTPPLVHQDAVVAVAWGPNGQRVATASQDHTARVWDVVSGQEVTLPLAHQGEVWAVVWSPDGERVATASQDHTARVWDADTGQAVTPPLAHQGVVRGVAWSPDGRWLATASDDQTARLWDVSWDTGTLAGWRAVIEERCDYRLNDDDVPVAQTPRTPASSLSPSRASPDPD